jgi:hypothetical protein
MITAARSSSMTIQLGDVARSPFFWTASKGSSALSLSHRKSIVMERTLKSHACPIQRGTASFHYVTYVAHGDTLGHRLGLTQISPQRRWRVARPQQRPAVANAA